MNQNRRLHNRIDVRYPVFIEAREYGRPAGRRIGWARNISRTGMLIETEATIAHDIVEVAFIDPRNTAHHIRGAIVYSRMDRGGRAVSGLCLLGDEDECTRFVAALYQAFRYAGQNALMTGGRARRAA